MVNTFKDGGYFVRRRKPKAKEFADAIKMMVQSEDTDVAIHYLLCRDDFDREWSLVIGWSDDGGSDEPPSKCHREGVRLIAKIGWQPYDAQMQTDIDLDYNFPTSYDEHGDMGDVFDTSVPIDSPDDAKAAVNEVWRHYMEIKKHWLRKPVL